MMVGDRIPRDIVNAKNLGIKTCFARYGAKAYNLDVEPSGADFEIENIKELLNIL